MSVDTKGKKRKSGDEVTLKVSKKVRTTKPAAEPVPLKSALKKSKIEVPKITGATPKKASKQPKIENRTSITRVNGKVVHSKIETSIMPPSDDDSDDGGATLSADQTAALMAGFSSDESEAEDQDGDEGGIDVSTLPSAPSAALEQARASTATSDPESTPGVIYLGRIPHGFYEKQMRAYFAQFGTITHLRLARNRRTGHSKHYAFVEFASSAVAEIVAKTMDKYLLFGHILQARCVPREQVKENIWIQGKTPWRAAPRNKMERGVLRRGLDRDGWEKRVTKEEKRRKEKEGKLKELGYKFEMPEVKQVGDVPIKATEIEEEKDNDAVVEVAAVVQVEEDSGKTTEKKMVKKRKTSGPETGEKGKKKAKAARATRV